MAPAQYAPLPNPRSVPDADRELDEAFGSEYDETDELTHDDTESTPFISTSERRQPLSVNTPGTYDFERDYDYAQPPPGSPPSPSTFARPNTWGNSNGELPIAPAIPPPARPTFFRRVIGSLLPQHYQRVPTEPSSSRTRGGGVENDGVFANVTAKPGRGIEVRTEDGNVHMVPEESQKEAPPTYNEAQADAVPGYWDRTTVHAPANMDPNADMIVEDLPTGSVVLFCANMFISYFFNFVGFLLTYLLHTSHAAKYGSRAGLGLSLIQYGFYSRNKQNLEYNDNEPLLYWNTTTGMLQAVEPQHDHPLNAPLAQNGTLVDGSVPEGYDISSRDWLAFLFMTLGWFLLLSSVVGYYRVKRWESSIRASNAPPVSPVSSEDRQREAQLRRDFERAFLMPLYEEPDENNERRVDEQPPNSATEAELNLARNLRAAGFL